MKKFFVTALALIMLLSTLAPAFAATSQQQDFKVFKGDFAVAAQRMKNAMATGKSSADFSDLNLPTGKIYDSEHDVGEFIWAVFDLYAKYDRIGQNTSFQFDCDNGRPLQVLIPATVHSKTQNNAINAVVTKFKNAASAANLANDLDKVLFTYNFVKEMGLYSTDDMYFYPYNVLCEGRYYAAAMEYTFEMLAQEIGLDAYIANNVYNEDGRARVSYFNLVFVNGYGYYINIDANNLNNKYLVVSQDKLAEVKENPSTWTALRLTSVYGLFNTKNYDNAWWTESVNGMVYRDGYWYYTDGADLYRGSTVTLTSEKLTNHAAADYNWNNKKLCDVVAVGNNLYFSSPNAINRYNIATGAERTALYALTDAEKAGGRFIVDLDVDGDKIIYSLASDYRGVWTASYVLATGSYTIVCDEHTFGEWKKYNDGADCQHMGKDRRYCQNCSFFEERDNSSRGPHVFETWSVSVPATCIQNGAETSTCKYCDATSTRETAKAAHRFTSWTTTKEPTCVDRGSKISYCDTEGCDASKVSSIPATGVHIDDDDDGLCDFCSLDMRVANCKCKCHRGGIVGFFFKIRLFFDRIFGIKKLKYCDCGQAHY